MGDNPNRPEWLWEKAPYPMPITTNSASARDIRAYIEYLEREMEKGKSSGYNMPSGCVDCPKLWDCLLECREVCEEASP